jgi:hypothetical protein
MLCHPGATRTEAAFRQHFDWKGSRTMVHATCKEMSDLPKTKQPTKNMVNSQLK